MVEGFEKIRRSWAFTNPCRMRVRVTVRAGSKPGQNWSGSCELIPGDWEEFEAHRDQRIEVFDVSGEHPVLLRKGSVDELAEPTINLMARVFEMPVEELHALWSGLEEEHLKRTAVPTKASPSKPRISGILAGFGSGIPDKPEPAFPGTELEEVEEAKLDDEALLAACAAFRMNDLGGLHVRPARLIQKALEPLRGDFEFVEFLHTGNGRTARIRREETSPPLWLLLLRLEVRQNEVIAVRAAAGAPQKAITTMAAVEGVLAQPKLERHDYWRMLGPDAYFRTYLSDFLEPDALDLRRRYRLLDKAVLERGAPPPPGTPMAQRV